MGKEREDRRDRERPVRPDRELVRYTGTCSECGYQIDRNYRVVKGTRPTLSLGCPRCKKTSISLAAAAG